MAAASASGDYVIRRFEPDDAEGVRALVERIYGDSYVHAELYHREKLIRVQETGQQVSIVAVHPAGGVVGHYAIERFDLGIIAEGGEAMVDPDHRHHQLMERMHAVVRETARQIELSGLYGRAVTNHLFTQKMYDHTDARPCGISLGLAPRTFHNMPGALPQRMSTVLYFDFLRSPASHAVHVPQRHRDIVGRVFAQFPVPVEFRPGAPATGIGKIETVVEPAQQLAVIRVRTVGPDSAGEIARLQKSYRDSGIEVVFLELPLAQPGTPDLCQALEATGFFFSGVAPLAAADGHALRLQCLNVGLDESLLQIETAFARELLAYVAAERRRVASSF